MREFQELVASPEPAIDLARGALLIAQIEHPGLDPTPTLARLDVLARRSEAAALADPRQRLERLRRFLFEEEGFRGNAEDYYDPRNSCLNDVLDRKLGIPITLSILAMELGRRLALSIHGVGLPGHFVVRAEIDGEGILLDPFNAGAVLGLDGAADVAARAVGRPLELRDEHLDALSKKSILTRMLLNLQAIYVRTEAWTKAVAVLDRLLLLDPRSSTYLRNRGGVLVKLGRLAEAAREWEQYLERHAGAEDAPDVRRELRRVRQALATLN